MKAHVSAITLGVQDVNRAKGFYSDGLGWPIRQDFGQWVDFSLNDGSTVLGLYAWDALAADAGVPVDGSGFRGVAFSYFVSSVDRVDAVLAEAQKAGGTIAKAGQSSDWGGYFGYFADPDGYLWKVVASEQEEPTVAE